MNRETGELPQGMMQSRPDQGALLTLLARLVRRAVALEVGTFTGYGAICIARGLAEGGRLTCFEVDEHWAGDRARATSRRRASRDRATVEVGPAARARSTGSPRSRTSTSPTSTPTRPAIPATTTRSSRACAPAALLVLDNTLLSGRVLDPQDDRARTMAALNERIAADERVDSVLLGLADGVTLVRKR